MNSKIASNPASTQTMPKKETGTGFWLWLPLIALPAIVQALPNDAVVQGVRQSLDAAAGGTVEMRQSEVTGLATFMAAPRGKPIPTFAPPTAKADDRSRQFLNLYGKAFGLTLPEQLQVQKVQGPDNVGIEHVRYRQLHRGVPITGGEIIVHMKGTNVTAVNAKTLPDLDTVNTTPTITPQQASIAAQEVLVKHLNVNDAQFSTPRLEVFNRGLLEGRSSPTRLAWFIEATKVGVREYIWVDAQRGGILLHFSQLNDAKSRSIYTANNKNTLPGTLLRTEGQLFTGDVDADKAYDYAGDTYDYFFIQHGRDSFDGIGAVLKSSVHYCPTSASSDCPYKNAFWNGTQMIYGDGFSSADDVVAHELTHAVTQYSANLFYYMQSGALNESYSDIFGETIDLTNNLGTDTPSVRWLIGEDLPKSIIPNGALRNMMNPNQFSDPNKVSDQNFKCYEADYGAVHSNSGVSNHAYALMVDGGSYNGKSIVGIGLTKAGKIQYRALTNYLISGSGFLDDYNALQQACADLIGIFGITSSDCSQVKKALDAVELGNSVCSQPPTPSLCPIGQVATDIFFDNLENPNSGNWTTTTLSGLNHWQDTTYCKGTPEIYCPNYATSGIYSFWGYDIPTIGDSVVSMTKSISIPTGTIRLQFNHSFGFKNSSTVYLDGGVIEYSKDNGLTWLDAGALITDGSTYSGTIGSGIVGVDFKNPLSGRKAFGGDTFGYTSSQLNLSSLASNNIRFRFRIGTDNSDSDIGWFIDDIRIYSCAAPPQPDFTITGITINPNNPTINGIFDAIITVKNQGTAAGTVGTVQLWANQSNAQACNAIGDKSGTVGNLAAGASTTVTISGIPAGTTGIKILRAFVDSKCETTETNETNNQFTLNYAVGTANLAVTTNLNGTVTSSPTGINCGTACSYDFPFNTSITLSATPNTGYVLGSWGGACNGTSETSPCVLNMDSAKTVSTTFNPAPTTYQLTVTKNGAGTVTSVQTGINCGTTCTANFNSATQVTLKSAPATGYAFGNWSGCDSVTAGGNCLVTMAATKSVSASFNPILYLNVGTNGSVTSNPVLCPDLFKSPGF